MADLISGKSKSKKQPEMEGICIPYPRKRQAGDHCDWRTGDWRCRRREGLRVHGRAPATERQMSCCDWSAILGFCAKNESQSRERRSRERREREGSLKFELCRFQLSKSNVKVFLFKFKSGTFIVPARQDLWGGQ